MVKRVSTFCLFVSVLSAFSVADRSIGAESGGTLGVSFDGGARGAGVDGTHDGGSGEASGGGFDRAIAALSSRTVRLFGLKAGLSVGYGSGVLISDDGLVVTVASLLLDADNLRAVTPDGTMYGADVLATDETVQLALLRLRSVPRYDRRGRRVPGGAVGPGMFDYFQPGDSRALSPGDFAIAGGNPFKVSQKEEPISVTAGVFSARIALDARRKTRAFPYHGEVLVIDAITSTPGSPGGPLVNLEGAWVGVIGRMVVSNRTHTNFNYAIPVEVVMDFVTSVLHPEAADSRHAAGAGGSESEGVPYHGIKLFELGYQKKMVYVDAVKRGSPARRAGVRKDDLIVSVNGLQVNDIETFKRIVSAARPGDTLRLVMIRNEKLRNVTLELEAPR